MNNAKFRLDFEVETCFDIDNKMEILLPDGSLIVFNKSRGKNYGSLFFKIDQPSEDVAKNKGQQIVEDFLTHLLITKSNLEKIKPIKVLHNPELLNPEDFTGIPITVSKSLSMSVVIAVKLEQKELTETSDLISKIEKLSEKEKNIIRRSLRWFRKASETDGEDKFIFRWISFEALLGLLEKAKATHKLISEFIDRFLETETACRLFQKHQQIIRDLSAAYLVSFRGVNYGEKLCSFLKEKKHPRAVLPKVALCIYEVRNELFHKGEVLKLMKGSSSFLGDIIRECLKFYVQRDNH